MTQSAPRAHGLDTLRALAIVSVMLYHLSVFHGQGTLPEWLLPSVRMGWMGVDLFFVLSGYLIGTQFLRPYASGERPSLKHFYRNRLFRILPVYLVVLAVYLAVPWWRESANLPPVWQLLTFTENLFVDRSKYHAFSHVWSLCVEEHFYLFFPLLVVAAMRRPSLRRGVAILAALVLGGMVLRGYFLFHLIRPLAATEDGSGAAFIERIYYPTYSHLDGLLAGVSLAVIRVFRPLIWSALKRRGHALLAAGCATVAGAVYLTRDFWWSADPVSSVGDVIGFPVLALGLGLVVASAVSANGWLRFKVPGARLMATLAYSLYLTHKELIHIVDRCFPAIARGAMPAWLCIYAAFCLVAAAVLYLCVERPFLKLRDRLPSAA